MPSGWDLSSATCNDGSPVSNISIGIGEDVTCTFTNQKRGQIVVVKDAQPNDAQDFSFTAGGGLSPASFQLDDDADGDAFEHRDLRQRAAGRPGTRWPRRCPRGWAQTSATCNDGSPVSNINVSPGETVTVHVHEPEAGLASRSSRTRTPNDAAGLQLHRRRRPQPVQLPARRRRRRDALEHPHASPTSPPGSRLLAVGGGAERLGPDQRHLRRRQPGVEHQPRRRARTSPARSRTASAARSWSSRTRPPTTRRTSASPPAAGSAPRASRSTTTRTARCRTPGPSRTSCPAPASRCPRRCPAAGTRPAPRVTTAARCPTSMWRPARR